MKLMERTRLLPIVLLTSAILSGSTGQASSPVAVTAAFEKLESLVGNWEGKDNDGKGAQTNFKLVAGNTAVLETLSMSGMEEMLTLYSIDGDGVALVHYCPTNNQPHMRAIPPRGEIKQLVFSFQSATNLPDLATGHEHELVIQFEDKDHITEQWTWRKKGNDTKMVYHFARKGGG